MMSYAAIRGLGLEVVYLSVPACLSTDFTSFGYDGLQTTFCNLQALPMYSEVVRCPILSCQQVQYLLL